MINRSLNSIFQRKPSAGDRKNVKMDFIPNEELRGIC